MDTELVIRKIASYVEQKEDPFAKYPEETQELIGQMFGLGPKAKPYVPSYRDCPKCGEKKARVKEVHADTGMDDFELKCDACGEWSDIDHEKSAAACPECGTEDSGGYYDIRDFCPTCAQAGGMGKAASVRSAVLGGYAYTTPTGPPPMPWTKDTDPFPRESKVSMRSRVVTPSELRCLALTGKSAGIRRKSPMGGDDLAAGLHQQRHVEVGFDQVGDPSTQDDVSADVGFRGVQSVGADNVGVAASTGAGAPQTNLVSRFGQPPKLHRLPGVKAATILALPSSDQILDCKVADPALTLGARSNVTKEGRKAPLQGLGCLSPPSSLLFKAASVTGPDAGLATVTNERLPALRKVPQRKSPAALFADLPPRFELGDGGIPTLRKDAGVLGPLSNPFSNRFGQVDLHLLWSAPHLEKVATLNKVELFTRKPAPLRESGGSPVLAPCAAGNVERRVDLSQALVKLARYRRFHHAKNNPSAAQVKAKNYKMGHLSFQGLDITIENEKGSIRRGVDTSGKRWESTLACPYGYIRSVPSGEAGKRLAPKAADGDHLDVFIGPDRSSDLVVVIDQYFNGKYDESKFVLGCKNQDQAVKLYRSNYQRGWPEMPVSTSTVPQLKKWLKEGNTKKPFKGQMVKAADWKNTCPGCGTEATWGGEREKPSKDLCHKCTPQCEHGIDVPFNTCDYGCKKPIEKKASAVDTVSDWMRGDAEGQDWRWGLLGPTMASLPVGLANRAYARGAMPRFAGAPKNLAERKMFRALKAQADKEGISVYSHNKDARGEPSSSLLNVLRKRMGIRPKGKPVSTSFNPFLGEINMAKGTKHPAILAHELGHARGGKGLMAANIGGKMGIGALTQMAMFSPDEESSKMWAGAGTLAGGGVLASELDASRRGYQAMRALGSGRRGALKAFAGIPTYLGLAGIPGLAHLTKREMGGFED